MKKTLTRNRRPRLDVPLQMPDAPPPKVVTTSLVTLAKRAKLSPQELSDFVVAQTEELKQLQILNAKTSITGFPLVQQELDAMLGVFDSLSNKGEMAQEILKSSGLQGSELNNFALKLARMGIHQ